MRTTRYARGKQRYRAPELIELSTQRYNNKSDIWSLGCIAYEVFNEFPAFSHDFAVHEFVKSEGNLGLLVDQLDARGFEFFTSYIEPLLKIRPAARPSAREVLQRLTTRPTTLERRSKQCLISAVPTIESLWHTQVSTLSDQSSTLFSYHKEEVPMAIAYKDSLAHKRGRSLEEWLMMIYQQLVYHGAASPETASRVALLLALDDERSTFEQLNQSRAKFRTTIIAQYSLPDGGSRIYAWNNGHLFMINVNLDGRGLILRDVLVFKAKSVSNQSRSGSISFNFNIRVKRRKFPNARISSRLLKVIAQGDFRWTDTPREGDFMAVSAFEQTIQVWSIWIPSIRNPIVSRHSHVPSSGSIEL